MKRIARLIFIFFLTYCPFASAQVSIRVPEQVSAKPGDSVLVPIIIDDASAIAGGFITLTFEENLVSVDAVEKSSLIDDFQFVSHIIGAEVRLAFSNASGLSVGNGTIATIALRVNSQTEDRVTGVLALSQADFYDENAQEIATTVINATVDLTPSFVQFSLAVPQGLGLVHLPLAVRAINAEPTEMRTIGDFYDALGPENVNFIITFDSVAGAWRSYLGPSSRGTPADLPITADTGILTLMKDPVTLHLEGHPWSVTGMSTIQLRPGLNLIGVPLKDERLKQVSDLLGLEGLRNNATAIVVYDEGKFKVVTQPGDDGDVPITGEAAFIMTTREAAGVEIRGEGWGKMLD